MGKFKTMAIEQQLKNNTLSTIKRQLNPMSRNAKLVILNTIGVTKASMDDMEDSLLVSKFMILYSEYLDGLDLDNLVRDDNYYKAAMFISGDNKKELETLIKNY